MNTVFIVPTGIEATIGGHAGDANPALKLIASVSDIAITHPNVVNASDINEMPENAWYVEGSILDRFLEGLIGLEKPRGNRILLVTNKPTTNETLNAVSAARFTIGCKIQVVELNKDLVMIAKMENGVATGDVRGWRELIDQVRGYKYGALAIATRITCPKDVALNYFRNGGVNPWGGVEALASKLIASELDKPVAHAPVENEDQEISTFSEVVEPRMAAEVLSTAYIHCVFKGLHKAPRISLNSTALWKDDIDCLITPDDCFGRPHEACLKAGIPVIVVTENKTLGNSSMPSSFYHVKNYLEAAGLVACLKEGMTIESVSVDRLSYG